MTCPRRVCFTYQPLIYLCWMIQASSRCMNRGEPYEFQDAHQLLSDFFKEVDEVMKEMLRP